MKTLFGVQCRHAAALAHPDPSGSQCEFQALLVPCRFARAWTVLRADRER